MTSTILFLALAAAGPGPAEIAGAEASAAVPAAAVVIQQQGRGQQNRPPQAQQRGQEDRPQQAQQGRGQQNRPQQAQQGRGQENRPQQAQQGRGQENRPQQAQQGRGQENRPQQAQQGRGQQQRQQAASSDASRGPSRAQARANASERLREMPDPIRRLATGRRPHERLIAGAATWGVMRGLDPGAIQVRQQASHLVLTGRNGDVLLEMDERRGRDLGHWTLRRLGDQRPHGNSPSFCRSGAGHPVWGREWCLDKGFGLGSRSGTIWSRTRVDDVIFRRGTTRDRLTRPVLIDVLGDVVFGRLALHALSLGHADPLHGMWIAEPNAPRILHVYSGDTVVAELVDLDRNDRVDVLYVVQPLR